METKIYDVIVIGAGPAGLTAALYTSRALLDTLVIEGLSTVSQILITEEVENFPGFLNITGTEISEKLKEQAVNYGSEIISDDVIKIEEDICCNNSCWRVVTHKGSYKGCTIILASGASPRYLNVPGEKDFIGRGVSYCAMCDGAFFKDKEIIVVGGGNTAVEESVFLTKFVKKVTVVHRRNEFRATKLLQKRLFANKKIEVLWDSEVRDIYGDKRVQGVKIENIKTNKMTNFACNGVFVFIGYIPNVDFIKNKVKLDEGNYIITDTQMRTSAEGIFACGDCRNTNLRQIVTACGDGAIAAASAHDYIKGKMEE